MNYFQGCINVAQVKTLFRELALRWHPDRGGDLRTMQTINAQYHEALKSLHKSESFDGSGEKRTYYYNEATENEIMTVVSALLSLRMPNVDIQIIGLYVWVTGDTRANKDSIKTVKGMRYHSERQCWFFKPAALNNYKPRFSGKSLDDLADTYGRKSFHNSAHAPAVKH